MGETEDLHPQETTGREFRSDPKFYAYRETLEVEVKPVEWTVTQVEWKHEVIHMEMTETAIVSETWEEPRLTPEEEALQACYHYFLDIGCEGSRRGRLPVVRLPHGVDEWSLFLDGDILTVEKVLGSSWTEKRAKAFKVTLSDPESLPKALAHMQKHTKFLRGGLGDHIPTLKAE